MDGEISLPQGLRVYWRMWVPDAPARATVVLTHGLGEHCGRYEHVAEAFINDGIRLYAYDLPAHGKSGGKRGHVDSYDVLLDALGAVHAVAKDSNDGRPLFLYGHSFGGQITLNYLLRRNQAVTGAIITDPWLMLPTAPPAWKLALSKLLNTLWPSLTLGNELDPTAISRDPVVVKAYIDDPLVHDRISVRLYNEGAAAAAYALEHAADIHVPLLLMHGTADRLTGVQGSRTFHNRRGAADHTYIEYEGFFHEVHNEPEKAKVLADMTAWLNKHIG